MLAAMHNTDITHIGSRRLRWIAIDFASETN